VTSKRILHIDNMPLPNSTTGIPPKWKAHPLWKIRKLQLITLAVSIIIVLMGLVNISFWLLCSFVLIIYDLTTYLQQAVRLLCNRIAYLEAQYKPQLSQTVDRNGNRRFTYTDSDPEPSYQHQQPPNNTHQQPHVANNVTDNSNNNNDDDKSPIWPRLPIMIADLILAIILLVVSVIVSVVLISESGYYYSGAVVIWTAYLDLAVVILAGLHAFAFYKQYIARKKASWRRAMRAAAATADAGIPCKICGRASSLQAPALPKQPKGKGRAWFRFGRDEVSGNGERTCGSDVEQGPCESVAGSEAETSGLLVSTTPDEDEREGLGGEEEEDEREILRQIRVGYGTLEGPVGNAGAGSTAWAAQPVRKKSSKRVVGEEWGEKEKEKKKGKGKVKMVDPADDISA
jgi:hypothetical protein